MSGKMKKLICALLAGTMLLSSAGMLAFADETPAEDNAAATTEATEAPEATAEAAEATEAPEATEATATEAAAEATAAPEATQAPEAPVTPVAATKYDSDNYYKKALALCQGLGIIKGDEQGNVNPENLVTRAEMAAIILRMLNNNGLSTYQNIFSDVSTSHWAADTVQTASALGIVNGFPGGTFVPDGDVQYEQIAKMIVCAMNYQSSADYYGGYPNGYMKVAGDLDITKSAPGSVGVAAERGVVIKMVYNALLADYNEPSGTQYGQQQYKAERTLAEYAFDVKEAKGILLGTAVTSLTGAKLTKGQAALKENGEDEIFIYQTALENLEDVLASNVTYYYKEVDGDTRDLLAIAENTAKTTSRTLTNKELDDIDDGGFKITEGKIEMYSSKDIKLADNITVIYNGEVLTEAEYEKAVDADKNKEDVRLWNEDKTAKTFDQFLQPVVGTIKLVNNDDDSKYDIVFIDSYETMLVTSATTKKVIGKINNVSATINVDESANDLIISTTINGMEAAPRNLKKNSVVSIKRSFDDETMEFVSTGETITGAINSYEKNDDGRIYTVTISGKDYDVDANAAKDCEKTGAQATFYMDKFGRIGYVEALTSDGLLQAGEKYGWIINTYPSDDGESIIVKLFTQEGKAVEATLASNVDFWGNKDTKNSRITADEVYGNLTATSKTGVTSLDNNAFLKMDKTPIRLIKYKMNSSSEISRMYCAVDPAKVKSEAALRIDPKNLNGYGGAALNGAVNGKYIADGIIEFTVPQVASDMNVASNYAVGEVVASKYVVAEDGPSATFVIGEFSDTTNANILINFTASATAAAQLSGDGGMDTANNGPEIMVVNKIAKGYDSENDMPVYTISGYKGGSNVSVTTNRNTSYGEAPASGSVTSGKFFNFTAKWNAPEHANSVDLTKYIEKGDILLYTSDGKLIAQFASASKAKFNAETGEFDVKSIPTIGKEQSFNSNSRIRYYFDAVAESDLGDTAWVKLENIGSTVMFDASMAIDVVTISANGEGANVRVEKETASISEIEEGDYIFVAYGNKGRSISSMIIYRVR